MFSIYNSCWRVISPATIAEMGIFYRDSQSKTLLSIHVDAYTSPMRANLVHIHT
jgi:hypothetical protein